MHIYCGGEVKLVYFVFHGHEKAACVAAFCTEPGVCGT